jgi:hypothetical protein
MKKTIWYVAFLILVGSVAALADPITITIDNTPLIGAAGATLTFDATITNNTGGLLYLNGDNFNLAAPFVATDANDSAFFTSWPSTLSAGESFGSAALFSIVVPAGIAPGIYDSIFGVVGGPGVNDDNLLSSAAFEIDVPASSPVVPEPGTFSLTLLGMAGLAAMSLKRLYA